MRIWGTIWGLAALTVMAVPAYADEYTVSALLVEKNLKARKPYTAALSYTKSGDPKIIQACYLWSGEGPYCFKARDNSSDGRFESRLHTDNPGKYRLEGFIRYRVGSKIFESNHASSTITVTR